MVKYYDLEDEVSMNDLSNTVFIDSEGSISRTGGSKTKPFTTYYVGLISFIHVKNGAAIKMDTSHIKLPEEIPRDHFKQWQMMRYGIPGQFPGHGIPFHQQGIPLEQWLQNFYQYLIDNDFPIVLAKGKALEERLINNMGLQGDTVCIKQYKTQNHYIPILDINDHCRKYSDVCPGMVHRPIKELIFFLNELKRSKLL